MNTVTMIVVLCIPSVYMIVQYYKGRKVIEVLEELGVVDE